MLPGVYLLVAGIHSGIGVARDGVLVRSNLGRAHWIPWPEIEKFEIVSPPNWIGDYRAIAVVRRGKSPLIADACAYIPWSKRTESNRKILQDLLRALEDERIAAQRPERCSRSRPVMPPAGTSGSRMDVCRLVEVVGWLRWKPAIPSPSAQGKPRRPGHG